MKKHDELNREESEEELSRQRIDEALELYENDGEDAIYEIQDMLSEEEYEIFMDEIDEFEDVYDEDETHDAICMFVSNEERKNELCAVFPAYAILEMAKYTADIVKDLDRFLRREGAQQGHFVLYKNSNKLCDSSDIVLSYHPKNKYEHREEFQLFIEKVISILKAEVPLMPPTEYPEPYTYKITFAFDDAEEEVSVIFIENTSEYKMPELSAACLFGRNLSISEKGLNKFAEVMFQEKR